MVISKNVRRAAQEEVTRQLGLLFNGLEIDPNFIDSVRQVTDTAALEAQIANVGDEIYVRSRRCNFRLAATTRGKYLRVVGNSVGSYTGNQLSISVASLTGGQSLVLPVDSKLQFWTRVEAGTSFPTSSLDIALHNTYCGFRTSTGTNRFEVTDTASKTYLEVLSVETEAGEKVDPNNVSSGVWYYVQVRIKATLTITSDRFIRVGTWLDLVAPYNVRHFRDFRIIGAQRLDTTPVTFYKNFETGTPDGMTEVATVTYPDNESKHNGLDVFEFVGPVEDPYFRQYRIAVKTDGVTPENFGAKRLLSTYDYSPDKDSTAIIQAILNSGYNLYVDGCYCVLGTLNVLKPKRISMLGVPNLSKRVTDGGVGCLYAGAAAVDMFRIFTEGFSVEGGLIDVRNVIYSGRHAPYYVPPSVFKYFYFYNLIQSGSLRTHIVGDKDVTKQYNAGHFGVSIDCSRTLAEDPKTFQSGAGFAELHYVNLGLTFAFLHTGVMTSVEEPYQSYSGLSLSHASSARFPSVGAPGVVTATLSSGKYTASSASDYAVGTGVMRYFTIKWGTDKILSLRAKFEGNNAAILAAINAQILKFGYLINTDQTLASASVATSARQRTNDVSTISTQAPHGLVAGNHVVVAGLSGTGYNGTLVVIDAPTTTSFRVNSQGADEISTVDTGGTCVKQNIAFQAVRHISHGGGADENTLKQSFSIQTNLGAAFTLNVFRPPLATLNNVVMNSVGCKRAGLFDTWDACTVQADLQTADVLSPAEYLYHLVTLVGSGIEHELRAIDINKGNINLPFYRTNKFSWENWGEGNEPTGGSLKSLSLGQVIHPGRMESSSQLLRNPTLLQYSSSGINRKGFIGPVDNQLLMAHERYLVTVTGTLANAASNVSGVSNIFIPGTAGAAINYQNDAGFDILNGTVVITIEPKVTDPVTTQLGIELLSLYLQVGSANTPRQATIEVQGTGANVVISRDLSGPYNDFWDFETFNANNNTKIILTLTGVKDKSQPVTIMHLMGKGKLSTTAASPMLTTAGGVTIFNSTKFVEAATKGADGKFYKLMPAANGTVTAVEIV